jgi:hypothetical protein
MKAGTWLPVELLETTPHFWLVNVIASLKFSHEWGGQTLYDAPTSMNYDGAEGLEFGGVNTKIDPSVASGQLWWFAK